MNAEQREQALFRGLQGIKSLTISQQHFDGTENNVLDWLEDFDCYTKETKRQSNEAKLFALVHHLSGEAKQWFQLQNNTTKNSDDNLRTALKEKFSPTAQEKIALRAKIYSTKQQPQEHFKDYVRKQQLAARVIELTQDDPKARDSGGTT